MKYLLIWAGLSAGNIFYDFFAGKATYITSVQKEIWKVIGASHMAIDSVLSFEKTLTKLVSR